VQLEFSQLPTAERYKKMILDTSTNTNSFGDEDEHAGRHDAAGAHAWNEFLFALALTNTFAATGPLAMVSFRNEYGVQWTAIGAAALIISTPVVLFAVVMQRFLVRGLTMGSVKG
jgi:hypothetical protein